MNRIKQLEAEVFESALAHITESFDDFLIDGLAFLANLAEVALRVASKDVVEAFKEEEEGIGMVGKTIDQFDIIFREYVAVVSLLLYTKITNHVLQPIQSFLGESHVGLDVVEVAFRVAGIIFEQLANNRLIHVLSRDGVDVLGCSLHKRQGRGFLWNRDLPEVLGA